ncbi:hypothetical protein CBR_g12856 [Chara braunii]|uniref:TOG domain-containing protein n=1 Tax=Chara braunii TaxID=69332 RepID=A0A388KSX1_CHABU|nr:hypothetical protein CBR_g12856 [Chara braunii]|eukprot:GBG73139.1 hypothetical protein CBR_g12856 [Chara braunii]
MKILTRRALQGALSAAAAAGRGQSPKPKPNVERGGPHQSQRQVEPVRVYSEKDLSKEIEKAAAMLVPETDWSVRMKVMQRVEGLVAGGASDFDAFPGMLLRQMKDAIAGQLQDRRSAIVRQTCQMLNLLAKELRFAFEPLAEFLIPVLLKLVVITVLVIAESADNCIRTMLLHCRVARIVPRIADSAMHDRSPPLRLRCCDYALLVLESWGEAPEVTRLADLYEELIKCCVGDAMSEVRATARQCYRVFALRWPDRGRRLFSRFDGSTQKLLTEEESLASTTSKGSSSSLSLTARELKGLVVGSRHAVSAAGTTTGQLSSLNQNANFQSGSHNDGSVSAPAGQPGQGQSVPTGKKQAAGGGGGPGSGRGNAAVNGGGEGNGNLQAKPSRIAVVAPTSPSREAAAAPASGYVSLYARRTCERVPQKVVGGDKLVGDEGVQESENLSGESSGNSCGRPLPCRAPASGGVSSVGARPGAMAKMPLEGLKPSRVEVDGGGLTIAIPGAQGPSNNNGPSNQNSPQTSASSASSSGAAAHRTGTALEGARRVLMPQSPVHGLVRDSVVAAGGIGLDINAKHSGNAASSEVSFPTAAGIVSSRRAMAADENTASGRYGEPVIDHGTEDSIHTFSVSDGLPSIAPRQGRRAMPGSGRLGGGLVQLNSVGGRGGGLPYYAARDDDERSVGSTKSSDDESLGTVASSLMAPSSRAGGDDLTTGLPEAIAAAYLANADWSSRVTAFVTLRKTLQNGQKGVSEVLANFDKVMILYSSFLGDSHHRVAQAALAALAELLPLCRKSFEAYLERILPLLFNRLIDQKEASRKMSARVLKTAAELYPIELLLPALLRSLDEQRSPKAKMAVIEFGVSALKRPRMAVGEHVPAVSSIMLKHWMSKLVPLTNDKQQKLRLTAVAGIVAVHSQLDANTVVSYIANMPIEEQSQLRKVLRQYAPAVEADLLLVQSGKQRQARIRSLMMDTRPTESAADTTAVAATRAGGGGGNTALDILGTVAGMGYQSPRSPQSPCVTERRRRRSGSLGAVEGAVFAAELAKDIDTGAGSLASRGLTGESSLNSLASVSTVCSARTVDDETMMMRSRKSLGGGREGRRCLGDMSTFAVLDGESNGVDGVDRVLERRRGSVGGGDKGMARSPVSPYRGTRNGALSPCRGGAALRRHTENDWSLLQQNMRDDGSVDAAIEGSGLGVIDGAENRERETRRALGSRSPGKFNGSGGRGRRRSSLGGGSSGGPSPWKGMPLSLGATATEEDDTLLARLVGQGRGTDERQEELQQVLQFCSSRQNGPAMPDEQDSLQDYMEAIAGNVIALKADQSKTAQECANECLDMIFSGMDPLRCLTVLLPQLETDDEKILVPCLGMLNEVVVRLTEEQLTDQLPLLLPPLYEAFGSPHAAVRKAVVLALVEMYMMLGDAFIPHLSGLPHTQLKLVTIYANRITQERMAQGVNRPTR